MVASDYLWCSMFTGKSYLFIQQGEALEVGGTGGNPLCLRCLG